MQYRQRSIRGFALFQVDRDAQVTKIDLLLSNVSISEYSSKSRLRGYARVLNEMMIQFGDLLSNLEYEDFLCHVRSKPVLCRVFYRGDRVAYVMLASFHSGVVSAISKRLEKMGWRRKFLLEFTSLRQRL